MDAHRQALRSGTAPDVTHVAAGMAFAVLVSACGFAIAAADPGFPNLDLQEQHGAGALDAETLALLDDVLRDPVDLNRGDLERLRHLPWLDAAAIEAVRAARPLASWDALAHLPGWSEARVRMSRAFVFLAPPTESGWGAEIASRALRTRAELLASASTSGARVEIRRTSDPLRRQTGYAVARLGAFRLLGGDLKANHAQGLLWASGPETLGTGSTALRLGRGFVGTTSLDPEHVLRGAALEVQAGPLLFDVASGANANVRVQAGAVQVAGRGMRVRTAALRRGNRTWVGSEVRRDVAQAGAALEVVHGEGGTAWALAARATQRGLQLAARLGQTGADVSPFAALVPRHAAALAEARWQHAGIDLRAAAAVTRGSDSLGTAVQDRSRTLEAGWNVRNIGLEARWSERRVRTTGVGVEVLEPDAHRVLRRLMARLRWERRRSRGWFEHRSVELTQSGAAAESGSSWQLGIEAERRPWRATLACTAFRVTHAHAAPVVPDPGLGGGTATWRLHGDGLRAALGLRFEHANATCRLRAAWQVRAPRVHDLLVEAALHLRKT